MHRPGHLPAPHPAPSASPRLGRIGWASPAIGAALLAAFVVIRPLGAQPPSPGDPRCNCPAQLRALAERVEANHPGYHLEVRGTAGEDRYRAAFESRMAEARTAETGLACLRVLQDYVAFLRDPHLFVGGASVLETAADSARVRAAAPPMVAVGKAALLAYLEDAGATLDPAEGIWSDPAGLKLAVAAEARVRPGPEEVEGRLVAFVLASANPAWAAGDVRAQFAPLADGSYDVVLYDDARRPTLPRVYARGVVGGAQLQRGGLLLHMPPTTWGKLHPVRPGQEGRIDPVDPRAPVVRTVDDGAVVFHVPSHSPDHAMRLLALTEQHRGALDRAGTLIVDLRGNHGGSSRTTDPLLPWIRTPERRPARYLAAGESAVLSSADNVRYFERQPWDPPGLVERLKMHPGEMVPFFDPAAGFGAAGWAAGGAQQDTRPAAPRPRRVALLTDGGSVSAAEAFVLRAMRFEKVTLFGEPTGGSIDYQTVSMVGFGCREAGLYVGYPVMAGSDRLPESGANATGIIPDVRIPPGVDEPVSWILDWYARQPAR